VFRCTGTGWTLGYAGRTARLPDAKGMHDLAVLLSRPGRPVPAAELVALSGGGRLARAGLALGADPVLDDRAKRAYRRRLEELDLEVAEAEDGGDPDRLEKARGEREAIAHELAAALGLRLRRRRPRDLADLSGRSGSGGIWRGSGADRRGAARTPRAPDPAREDAMSQLVFDDRLAAQLEELYRTRDVLRRRRLVREALRAGPGERVLDVGCGPGFYLAELLEQVGPTGSVTGVDASPQTLALARRRTDGAGDVRLHLADATALPVPDAAFDAAHMDRVLRAWDGHLAHPSLPRTLAPRLRAVGFTDVQVEGHTFATTEHIPDAYGAAILPLVQQYVTGRDGITDAEAAAWAAEQRQLGERGEFFFACIQFCFTATRPT
jgi:arsenite methyltransferase